MRVGCYQMNVLDLCSTIFLKQFLKIGQDTIGFGVQSAAVVNIKKHSYKETLGSCFQINGTFRGFSLY